MSGDFIIKLGDGKPCCVDPALRKAHAEGMREACWILESCNEIDLLPSDIAMVRASADRIERGNAPHPTGEKE